MSVENLAPLTDLSRRIGQRIDLIQGAGGNTSEKVGETLWVKASGTQLADAQDKNIFVGVKYRDLNEAILAGEDADFGDYVASPGALRPSIETSLHSLIPHAVVLHVHSVNALAILIQENSQAQLEQRLDGLRWATVPYCRPGNPLTHKVAEVMAGKDIDVLLLENHGLVVAADSCDHAEKLLLEVEERLATPESQIKAFDAALAAETPEGMYLPDAPVLHQLALDEKAVQVAGGGSLYPDHVVFLGRGAKVLPDHLPIADYLEELGEFPPLVIVPGRGVIVRKGLSANALSMVECLALVLQKLPETATVRYLSTQQEDELLDWDAEKYRQKLAKEGACKS